MTAGLRAGHLALIEDLERRLARVREGGGPRALERHRAILGLESITIPVCHSETGSTRPAEFSLEDCCIRV